MKIWLRIPKAYINDDVIEYTSVIPRLQPGDGRQKHETPRNSQASEAAAGNREPKSLY